MQMLGSPPTVYALAAATIVIMATRVLARAAFMAAARCR